jgi:hypothetical protein
LKVASEKVYNVGLDPRRFGSNKTSDIYTSHHEHSINYSNASFSSPARHTSHSKMRFSSILVFSTFALAAPQAPVVEERIPSIEIVERTPLEIQERGDSVVGSVLDAVNSVVQATEVNVGAIRKLNSTKTSVKHNCD